MSMTNEEKLALFVLEDGPAGGRKLKFHEQCAAFALLYGRTKPRIVARTFGVSSVTISNIGGCLVQDPDPTRRRLVYGRAGIEEKLDIRDHNQGRNTNRVMHYESVAREFEALGVAEFNRRYLTDEIMNRLAEARAQLREESKIPSLRPQRRPKAQKRPEEMSTAEVLAFYAAHPDEDPRNHGDES